MTGVDNEGKYMVIAVDSEEYKSPAWQDRYSKGVKKSESIQKYIDYDKLEKIRDNLEKYFQSVKNKIPLL